MSEHDRPYKPFDSAFKTLAHDCPQLMIPLVNEIFGTAFAPSDSVVLMDPKQMVPTEDGGLAAREVDSLFTILGERKMTFHVECQSKPDNTMVARFWEYDAHIALMNAEITPDGVMDVRFPRSAVLYLRHTERTPDTLRIRFDRGDGTRVDLYEIPIVKTQRYTLDELFDKGLFFLLPFHAFTHEARLAEYEADERQLDGLLRELEAIKSRLEDAVTSGRIDGYERSTVLMMLQVVLHGLAERQTKIMKGVDRSMGGVILDYEAKRILNRGIAQGVAKGRAEGKMELLCDLVGKGRLTELEASEEIRMPIADFQQRMAEYNRAHA